MSQNHSSYLSSASIIIGLTCFLLLFVGIIFYQEFRIRILEQRFEETKPALTSDYKETTDTELTDTNNDKKLTPTPSPLASAKPSATKAPVVTKKIIPLVSTNDWKTVSQNGVQYKIRPDMKCVVTDTPRVEDETNCKQVQYIWKTENGREITSTMLINVYEYKGGSRREQFFNEIDNGESEKYCNPIFADSQFGNVSALEIAYDTGACNGGGGGIVAVVGNKMVVFSNQSYNLTTKEVYRWDIRDTIVSTLKPL